METFRKGWNWEEIKEDKWNTPAEEVYYLAHRWKSLNKLRFLDLGCGKGRNSIFFAKEGFKVNAFDISESGILILRERAKEENLDIETSIGDMHSLPYKEESFDAILGYHVIYHTNKEGLQKVISEIRRVLAKDGEIFVTFNSKSAPSYKNPNNIVLEDGTVIKEEGIETGIPHYFVDKEEVLEFMKDFEIINMKYVEEIIPGRGCKYYVLAKKK
ncbi:MAG TPA: class I SAM-dependent methyltransferase [Dictyoglomaceae bacterium]|nr:class I SAM-dependent methyltransferase [Dictyoglomaceae bacterium]HOL39854.1 class I SAM-dependent methyltransferase [Dictyoglomaceae bacterium]HOP95545.1 class I SAM-dependent methyltransferase [Dictyoglomaceae bacterium]HPP16351.1 class I SAM-dependent methyltransferase [Dictyoglomaceae bacterium]HPU43420.1 class I SAM-dependent methyltransferase [Dictyoglomaceae bacterium]